MLWELRHPKWVLVLFAIIFAASVWQAGKLPKRLRGGLVNLPGSESETVREVVEREFSKVIAYPTILVQEELGTNAQTEENWRYALHRVKRLPQVQNVIDMRLGRKIVATVTVTNSFSQTKEAFIQAHETIQAMRQVKLPDDFGKPDVTVSREGAIQVILKTDVRSFKEGEARRREFQQGLEGIYLPVPPAVQIRVERNPRRNFAMVEANLNSYQDAETLAADLQNALGELDLPDGNRVRVTGLPALFYDLNREAVSALKKAEWIALPICFLMLIWVFQSSVAALLPILVALATLAMGSAAMSKVGKYMDISMFVPSVLAMIGLGVGVDYMLILLARFRESAARHPKIDEAIMEAMHRTSPILMSSAFTVAIGFSALIFTPVTLFRTMGIAGIIVIICALACIFVVSPPLFKVCHLYFSWGKPVEARTPFWKRWTHFVVKHPFYCLAAGVILMLLIARPTLDIRTASLNPETLPAHLESRKGYNLCRNGFGAGWLMPAVLIVESPYGTSAESYLEQEKAFIRQLRAMRSTFDAVGASDLSAAQDQGFSIEIPPNFFISRSGRFHLILAMFDGNPLSLEGRDWVQTLRQMGGMEWKAKEGFSFKVGGVVAGTIDMDGAIRVYLVRTVIFCLLTTFVCLAFMYRSVLIPLQAIGMNLLSVSAAYGFLVMWFQNGMGSLFGADVSGSSQGINSVVVLLLFCALFGLSMDYQVFLISRMAEEWRRSHNNELAVRHGIELTGRVVTGAAAIMITIFLSFAFVSVMETRQFGTGMAAAITFDATIIRLLIFPSAMLLVGQANWWWPFARPKQRSTG